MKKYPVYRLVAFIHLALLFLFLFSGCEKEAVESTSKSTVKAYQPNIERLSRYYQEIIDVSGDAMLDTAVLIDGNDNKLFLVCSNGRQLKIIASYDISASKYGYGSKRGSNMTPWGVHKIAGKYGDGEVLGMSFYDRKPTGEIATIYTDTTNVEIDPVTSRIIWLNGLEDLNLTSYWRFIYIHGTHEEGLLGTPQSKGCIRMRNREIIELFDLIDTGMVVNIIRPESYSETEE
ncbi:MAG: L,D-transpeptidase [Candidatus Marinimicrobia bacterium]|nr:L,D-transpeptidase [Candidatus Neomarinimicrobiota bacterium]